MAVDKAVRLNAPQAHERVELEHRRLEAHGNDAEKMRSSFHSDRGWSALLRAFAECLAGE